VVLLAFPRAVQYLFNVMYYRPLRSSDLEPISKPRLKEASVLC